MLGRNSYEAAELEWGRSAVAAQLAGFGKLTEPSAEFEALYFNAMILALDRPFVHRVRPVSGKDGNPLNEVELIVDSLIGNDGVFAGNKVIKYAPEKSVLGLAPGDRIRLTSDDFARLTTAFFAELERRFRPAG